MTTRLKKRERKETMRRRHFFRSFLADTISAFDEVRGQRQMSLNDLDKLPDDILRKMAPVRETFGPYAVEQNQLVALGTEGRALRVIHVLDDWEIHVWQQFDGMSTIDAISRQHTLTHGVQPDEAYQRVKSLFIALSSYMVCRPSGPNQSIDHRSG